METQAALQRIFPHPDWSQRAEIVLQRAKSQWTPIRPSVLPLPVELANVSPGPSEVPPDGIGLVSLLVG